jgi:hypothetical protein
MKNMRFLCSTLYMGEVEGSFTVNKPVTIHKRSCIMVYC